MDSNVIKEVRIQAKKHEVEIEAALAVFDVESAGVAFWNVDGKMLPAIRWEGHYFYARLNDKAQLEAAVKAGLAARGAGVIPNPKSYSNRYALLERAKQINEQAALESVSWGLGQVMGANWKMLGFNSVQELVDASKTVAGQVDTMFRFIDANGLQDEMNSHNWSAFEKVYNGPKAKGYARKMAIAYDKYKNNKSPGTDEYMLLQKMLNALGPYKLKEDGVYGDETRAAVRDFQLKNNLHVDGIYGPITREVLEKTYIAKNGQTTANVGAGTGAIGVTGTAFTEAAKGIQGFADNSQIIQWVFVGLIVLGALVTAYGLYRSLKK
jgi:hypothetical protein